ncbi:MAG TPA: RNA polymerase sigma-70 factor [Ktedonobacteraceae bacterium]|nr:RNA polymerase sigma-70 factor [Ktedonobacteraceae bacterium]
MNPDETFQAYRPLLFSIAYKMLGSAMDADDCLQDAYLRWHQRLEQGEVIRSPKTYLSTIVTHLCMDQLHSARNRREAYVGIWLPEPLLLTSSNDLAETVALSESLSIAFLFLLEHLSPVERAVFLLRQVFDYEYAEIAAIVGKSEENCRQIMRRARLHLNGRSPYHDVPLQQQKELTQSLLQACSSGDLDGLVSLLQADVVLHSDGGGKVSAARNPIYGAQKVARFLLGLMRKQHADFQGYITEVNGQAGIVVYHHNDPFLVMALDSAEGCIQQIDIIVNPDKLRSIPPQSDFVAQKHISMELSLHHEN